MINPPLRYIATFVCLSETQSFRRAAERLGLSQPAVSAHIRDLERTFGVPLVHRTTRHVSLTPEGQAFAARAKRALDDINMASQDLRDVAAIHRGRVVVACMPYFRISARIVVQSSRKYASPPMSVTSLTPRSAI